MTTRKFTTRIAYGAASIHTRAALEASRIAHEEDELDAFINSLKGYDDDD